MVEGVRALNVEPFKPKDGWKPSAAEPLLQPTAYPLVGASLSRFKRSDIDEVETATLGGYAIVDNAVYGLTNHHALFTNRMHPFPTPAEDPKNFPVEQPDKADLGRKIDAIEGAIRYYEDNARKKGKPDLYISEIATQKLQLAQYEAYKDDSARIIGNVFKTSGIKKLDGPPGGCYRMDWGLVHLNNPSRCPDPALFLNEVWS